MTDQQDEPGRSTPPEIKKLTQDVVGVDPQAQALINVKTWIEEDGIHIQGEDATTGEPVAILKPLDSPLTPEELAAIREAQQSGS